MDGGMSEVFDFMGNIPFEIAERESVNQIGTAASLNSVIQGQTQQRPCY